jgi:hypothetical protein
VDASASAITAALARAADVIALAHETGAFAARQRFGAIASHALLPIGAFETAVVAILRVRQEVGANPITAIVERIVTSDLARRSVRAHPVLTALSDGARLPAAAAVQYVGFRVDAFVAAESTVVRHLPAARAGGDEHDDRERPNVLPHAAHPGVEPEPLQPIRSDIVTSAA